MIMYMIDVGLCGNIFLKRFCRVMLASEARMQAVTSTPVLQKEVQIIQESNFSLENHLRYQLATRQMERFNLKKIEILFFNQKLLYAMILSSLQVFILQQMYMFIFFHIYYFMLYIYLNFTLHRLAMLFAVYSYVIFICE